MWRSLICLFAITVAIHVAKGRTTEKEAIAAVARALDEAVADDEFSGTVLIAKHGTPIFAKAYNRADRERGVPNVMDTSMNVGSINKMMTAVAILRLVQDGKLALTDTVGKHIAGYPNREVADQVTIHHLLTHTGGTGDIFEEDYLDYRLDLTSHDAYLKKFGERGLLHAPGARWQYSNYGFVLLGIIIERITGKPYYEAIQDLVYKPAGMTLTTYPRHDEHVGAIGYTSLRAELEPNTWVLPYRGMSAGGGWSTVGDLLRFANALQSHVLLDETHTKLATTGKVNIAFGFKYAYGFADMKIDGVRCVGHNGGFPGANGELLVCENGYTIAVLANFDPPAAGKIAMLAAKKLPK